MPNTMCLLNTYCNRNELFRFIPWHVFKFSIMITGNTAAGDINFKKLNFKSITKMLLVSMLFRTDNLEKLMVTIANWKHIVQ